METLVKAVKSHISTGSFLTLSLLVYLISDDNPAIEALIDSSLPANGRTLAFCTILGLIFIYELSIKNIKILKADNEFITGSLQDMAKTIEERHLISDTNAAFTEFKASGKDSITGEYYTKEILTLNDTRERLGVNSYTENKLKYLMSKIKYSDSTE